MLTSEVLPVSGSPMQEPQTKAKRPYQKLPNHALKNTSNPTQRARLK